MVGAIPNVKMSSMEKNVIVDIRFKPGQEFSLFSITTDWAQADIGYAFKPKPKANNIGVWVTT